MKINIKSATLISLLAVAGSAFCGALGVGNSAPPLKVAKWIKGQPIKSLTDGGVHVVEFWATWCGPCRESIPHLTELAKKYKGKADFTGVSVYEHGDNYMPTVVKFVKDMGAKMDYHVAADGPDHTMAKTWMEAAGQDGIPTAFVVGRDGKVAWIGHPMAGLDEVVGKVIDGTFDAKAEADKQRKAADEQAQAQELLAPLVSAMQSKDNAKVVVEADKLLGNGALPESFVPQVQMVKFDAQLQTDEPAAYKFADEMANTTFKDNADALNTIAWSIAGDDLKLKKPDYSVAIRIGQKAVDLKGGKDPMTLDTLAYAYFKSGNVSKAIELQTKAVSLLSSSKDVDPQSATDIKARLAKFKAAAK